MYCRLRLFPTNSESLPSFDYKEALKNLMSPKPHFGNFREVEEQGWYWLPNTRERHAFIKDHMLHYATCFEAIEIKVSL